MTWELYEVWTEDEFGHQALVEGAYMTVIFKETEDGDTEEIERLTLGQIDVII